jgi:hypothetical protein
VMDLFAGSEAEPGTKHPMGPHSPVSTFSSVQGPAEFLSCFA